MLTALLARLGQRTIGRLEEMGRMSLFLLAALGWLVRPPLRPHGILKQLHFIGAKSTVVVILTAAFTGMVLGLQLHYTLQRFGSEAVLGSAVGLSMIRELGPVLAALMVTARADESLPTVSHWITNRLRDAAQGGSGP